MYKRVIATLILSLFFYLSGCGSSDNASVTSEPQKQSPSIVGRPDSIPALREWKIGSGVYTFSSSSLIVLDAAYASQLANTGQVFADDLKALTGYTIPVVTATAANAGDIFMSLSSSDTALGAEGYSLAISDRVVISARNDAGAFYGTRTMLQLLKRSFTIEAGTARDWPSYPFRALMVDNGRKYYTIEWLQNHIKELAYLKMNYFHLHLSDDAGFRLQSRVHPEIMSAQYYTRAEMDALQVLAAKYHVLIVPEIDMPGHMRAILNKHPELCLGGPYYIDLGQEASYTFIKEIIDEFIPWFTGPYWHMGADEYVPINEPSIVAYAQSHYGSDDPRDTFLGFVNWMDALVKSKGKTLRVWNDGITSGGTKVKVNTDVVLEVWEGTSDPQITVDQGYTLMNSSCYYLYYVLGSTWWKPDNTALYESWEPHVFNGKKLLTPFDSKNQGAKLHIWSGVPGSETEDAVAFGVRETLRIIAQKTWATIMLGDTYASFQPVIESIGRAPNTTFKDP